VGVALAACLTVGAGTSLAAMPRLYAAAPHDLRRIQILLEALPSTPGTAVFGNSVAMCGIDAGRLGTREGSGPPPAYNLSSTGQTFAEGFLYYQDLPETTRTVVYSLSTFALESPVAFNAHVVNAFALGGYAPAVETRSDLEQAFPAEALREFDESPASQRFEARWAIRELIDSGLRRWIRRDLDLDRALRDLEFPAPYEKKLSPDQLDKDIGRTLAGRPPGPFRAAPEQVALLDRIVARGTRDGRRVVYAIAPIHPRLRAGYGPDFAPPLSALAERFRQAGATVLDSTALLDEDLFIDTVHPTKDGAARWTAAISAALDRLP
jgi:hypothetical protein